MKLDVVEIIKQIDFVISKRAEIANVSKYEDLSDQKLLLNELITLQQLTVERFAPVGSAFNKQLSKHLEDYDSKNPTITQRVFHGILLALKTAYQQGFLQTIEQVIHASLFADFLEMADYLSSQGYKDPAAVLAGGVLEESIKKHCAKAGIPTEKPTGEPLKTNFLNDELAKANVYDKLEQKSVTLWLDLRNKAAHGKYTEYTKEQVDLMIPGIRGFIQRNPA